MLKKLHDAIISKPITALLITGLFFRLLIVIIYQHVTIFPDSGGYIELATLISGGNISGYTGERTPGYPLLLSLCDNNLSIAVFLQIILGLITCIYIYKTLLITGFRKNTAVYISIALGNLLNIIFYEINILTESLTLFFITVALYKILALFINGYKGFGLVFLISFLLGYLTFIKPFYFYIPFIIYGLYFLQSASFKRIISPVIIILILPCISFFGWCYVNNVNTGQFTSTTYYGLNIAQICVSFAENVPDEYRTIGNIYAHHRELAIKNNQDVAMTIWFAKADLKKATGLNDIELYTLLGKYGKAAISQNTTGYLKQVAISWLSFWGSDIYWNYEDFAIPIARKPLLALWFLTKGGVIIFSKIIFILFTPVYLFRFFRTRVVSAQVVIYAIVWAASIAQALVAFGTNARYSFPFEVTIVISVLITADKYLRKYFPGKNLLNTPQP
ncbi:hypothetical protein [Flavobacterium psychrotrophum]|uniref:hypothetical protein n=1 Tax=Flavobacterium psychrotrophum TaxID=2294119 RepID=UPI0013C421B5|nr:hypothetical protein [Flavobacterium psychrotrophum]